MPTRRESEGVPHHDRRARFFSNPLETERHLEVDMTVPAGSTQSFPLIPIFCRPS